MGGCDEGVFEGTPALVELAAEDFFGWGVDEAELADGESVVFVADGWAEGAALHGTGSVEVAGSGNGIEDGAGFIVGEVVEGSFVVRMGEERAGGGVAGEVAGEACARGFGAATDMCGSGRVGGVEFGERGAEGFGVELRDREDADAALMAAGPAGEPVAGASGGGGECVVEDFEEHKTRRRDGALRLWHYHLC